MQVFFITPLLIITPFAGVMVDRHNRKLMMMVSDLTAGLATIAIHPHFAGLRRFGRVASLRGCDFSRIGKCFPMARLFRGDQNNDPKGKIWAHERHDVPDRGGSRSIGSHAGWSAFTSYWPNRNFVT